jgi:hypothetical protein
MVLDAILMSSELTWLGTDEEKVAFFALMAPSLARERLPHVTVGTGPAARLRFFPEQLPIGVETTGRVVFVYLVTTPVAHVRGFVQRHMELLRALPGWTLRLLFPQPLPALAASLAALVRDELTTRLSPDTLAELKWYFDQCRGTSDHLGRARVDERFWLARGAFSTPRYSELYRRWLTDGDDVFEGVSSTSVAEALARGTARIETRVLPRSYRHLSPLAAVRHSSPEGVEEGDRAVAQPQPPPPNSVTVADELTRDWYRLVGRT